MVGVIIESFWIVQNFIAWLERRLLQLLYREDWEVSYLRLDVVHSLRGRERLGASSLR